MKKFVIIGLACLACSISLGFGVSYAHTGGLLSVVDEPDWLERGQNAPVSVPRAASIITPTEQLPATEAISSLHTTSTRHAVPETAPLSSLAPMDRPIAQSAALPPLDGVDTATSRHTDPLVTQNTVTLEKADAFSGAQATIPHSAVPQQTLATPGLQPDAIDNVWLLGGYR